MPHRKQLILLLFLASQLFGSSWFQKDTLASTYEEEVYLSFRYKGIVDEIIVAYYKNDTFYLPVSELFDFFALNYNLNAGALSVNGYYLKEDDKYILDFKRLFAMRKDEVWSLNADDFLVKEVDFYLVPRVFKEVFGLDIQIDLSRLTMKMETPYVLPIVARYNRRYKEKLRQQYSNDQSDEVYELLHGRERQLLNGAFFDYTLYSNMDEYKQQTALNLGVGNELLYGDVQGNIQAGFGTGGESISASDIRWRYAVNPQPWISTVTVGQQSTPGLTPNSFNGVRVTNQPLVPIRTFDNYAIDGTTEPEAEVELYQDGRLMEMIKADDLGYYRFNVPLRYGTSDYMVRIYGKHGRIIDIDKRIQIPFNFLQVNEIRYTVASGRLFASGVPWSQRNDAAYGKVDMGLTNWLTAGLGLEYVTDFNQDRPIVYSKLSGRVLGDILVGVDAVLDNYYGVTVRGTGTNTSSIFGSYTYYAPQSVLNTSGYIHEFNSNMFYPFQFAGMRFTGRGSFSWISLLGNENRFNLIADFNQFVGSFRFRYGIQERHTFTPFGESHRSEIQLGAVYSIPRLPSINPFLRGSYLRTDLSVNTHIGVLEEIQIQFIKQFSSRLKAQMFSSMNLLQKYTSVELGISWDLNKAQSNSNIRSRASVLSASQTLRGSFGYDMSNQELIFDNRQQVGRAGVSVKMFVDENNSGQYEEGEELLPGNAVIIERASSRMITKSGITRLTQLQPYRQYNFRVNEARVNNPMLVASKKQFSIITDPNRYKEIYIPFFTTGVIDGRVDRIKNEEFVPISGLRIHIKMDGGDYETTVRTFSDGSFYSMEIPPGNYEAWIEETQLEFLRMNATPERLFFTVKADADGDYVEGLNFLLE